MVQNFAARVVLGLKKFDHISEGRTSLKWLNLSEILFNDLVLVFKCLNGLAPVYLVDYFLTPSATHNRNFKKVWRLEPSTLPVVSRATRFLLSRS